MTEPIKPATDEEIEVFKAWISRGPWLAARLVNLDGSDMSMDDLVEYVTQTVRMGSLNFLTVSCPHADGGRADVCHTGNGPTSGPNSKAIESLPSLLARIESDAAKLRERDEQIARYEDLLIDIKLALSNTKTFYLPLAEAVADIIRRKKEADRGAI